LGWELSNVGKDGQVGYWAMLDERRGGAWEQRLASGWLFVGERRMAGRWPVIRIGPVAEEDKDWVGAVGVSAVELREKFADRG